MKVKCEKEVWWGWRSRQCQRNAVKDGYCRQHHPEAVKKREAESRERAKVRDRASTWYKLKQATAAIEEVKRMMTVFSGEPVTYMEPEDIVAAVEVLEGWEERDEG